MRAIFVRPIVTALAGLALLSVQSGVARACRVSDWYFHMSPEQRASIAEHIFIGRVTEIRGGIVTMEIDETLRGPEMKVLRVEQGIGIDCRRIFLEGGKIFYAGDDGMGPTAQFGGELPGEVLPMVEKLRKNIPLAQAPDKNLEFHRPNQARRSRGQN